jgi:hypothetical protein
MFQMHKQTMLLYLFVWIKNAKIKRNYIAVKCRKKATMFYRWAKAP